MMAVPLRGEFDWHVALFATDAAVDYLANTAPVPAWRDLSGNGRDATQAAGALQPDWRASLASFNNRPAVRFNANDVLATANLTLPQPFTVVAVAKVNTIGALNVFAATDGAAGTEVVGIGASSALGNITGFTDGVNAIVQVNDDTSPHLFVGYFDGANSYYEHDGTRTAGTLTGAITAQPLLVGAGDAAAAAGGFNGDIAWLSLIAGDVSTHGSWPTFEQWVTSRYGIAIA